MYVSIYILFPANPRHVNRRWLARPLEDNRTYAIELRKTVARIINHSNQSMTESFVLYFEPHMHESFVNTKTKLYQIIINILNQTKIGIILWKNKHLVE